MELEPFKAKTDILKYEAAQELDRLRNESTKNLNFLRDENENLKLENSALEAETMNLKNHLKVLNDEINSKDLENNDIRDLKRRLHYLQEEIELSDANYHEELAKREDQILFLDSLVTKKSAELNQAMKQ
ncbi:hypothetical protein HK100_001127, partial [Physocladia obscura]